MHRLELAQNKQILPTVCRAGWLRRGDLRRGYCAEVTELSTLQDIRQVDAEASAMAVVVDGHTDFADTC